MANEIRVQVSLRILKGNLSYQSQPTSFQADLSGSKGPTPGAITVEVGGTDVSFAQVTTPGMARFQNLDDTNSVEWGIWSSADNNFFPVGLLKPGEQAILRLSPDILQDYVGTGTTPGDTTVLRFKAQNASCNVVVDIFDD